MATAARGDQRRSLKAAAGPGRLVFSLILLALATVPASAASGLSVVPLATAPDVRTVCYAVRATHEPILMILNGDVTQASLTAGTNVERVGSRVSYGTAPVGHGLPSFRLAPSAAPERLCVEGRNVRISEIPDSNALREALSAGRLSGFYIGIMVAIAIFQIAMIRMTRERVFVYYFLFLISLLGVEAVREGVTILPNVPQSIAYVFWTARADSAVRSFSSNSCVCVEKLRTYTGSSFSASSQW